MQVNSKLGRGDEQSVVDTTTTPKIFQNSGFRLTMNMKEVEVKRNDGSRVKLTVVLPDIIKDVSSEPTQSGIVRSSVRASNDAVQSTSPSSPTSSRTNPHKFTCFNCPKTFNNRFMLKRHEEIHKGDFRCSIRHCGLIYGNQTSLTKHFVERHGLQLPARSKRPYRRSTKNDPKPTLSQKSKEEPNDDSHEDVLVDHTPDHLLSSSGSYELYSESCSLVTATSSNSIIVEVNTEAIHFLDDPKPTLSQKFKEPNDDSHEDVLVDHTRDPLLSSSGLHELYSESCSLVTATSINSTDAEVNIEAIQFLDVLEIEIPFQCEEIFEDLLGNVDCHEFP